MAKRGIQSVYTVILVGRKSLSVLSCINAFGSMIHNYYIFKDRSFRRNFIIRYEQEVCMTIKKNVDDKNIVQRVD